MFEVIKILVNSGFFYKLQDGGGEMNLTLGNTYERKRIPGILLVFLVNLNKAKLKNYRK